MTEKEFMKLFMEVHEDATRANKLTQEDALEAAKRAGFTFDPEEELLPVKQCAFHISRAWLEIEGHASSFRFYAGEAPLRRALQSIHEIVTGGAK